MNINRADQIFKEIVDVKRKSSINITLINGMTTLTELIMENVNDENKVMKYCECILDSLLVTLNLSHENYDVCERVDEEIEINYYQV